MPPAHVSLARPALSALTAALVAACGPGEQVSSDATRLPDTIRVLAYNTHHGEGNDGILDLDRIGALIRDLKPDLVALQEIDRIVDRTGGVDQASVYAATTGLESVFGPFMPYQGGDYGMAVLSAWPIVESWNHRLTDGAEPRASATVRVRSPKTGRELLFSGVHLYRTEAERLAQARDLDAALHASGSADVPPIPQLLAGDFNSQPGGPVLAWLAEEATTPWWILPKDGPAHTFPSEAPVREIDFLMARPADRWEVVEHRVLFEPVASDHAPIFAVLVAR